MHRQIQGWIIKFPPVGKSQRSENLPFYAGILLSCRFILSITWNESELLFRPISYKTFKAIGLLHDQKHGKKCLILTSSSSTNWRKPFFCLYILVDILISVRRKFVFNVELFINNCEFELERFEAYSIVKYGRRIAFWRF